MYKTRKIKGGLQIIDCVLPENTTELVIPNEINGIKVVSIGNDFLFDNETLKSIVLPNSLQSTGDDFLCYNKELKSIVLPNSLQSIGGNFLFYNETLKLIVLPNSLQSIGDYFLYYNETLKSIVLPNGKKYKTKLIDDSMMIILSERKKDKYKILKCKYLYDMSDCIIVSKGNFNAHGKTARKAMIDLEFKILQSKVNVDKLAKEINTKGYITVKEHRLLTGACLHGINDFKKRKGIKGNRLSIKKLLKLTKGEFGHDVIVKYFNKGEQKC